MFEKATRRKYRFGTCKGNITTEDLWDLPLISADGFCLDDLAKDLNRAHKEAGEESFVKKESCAGSLLAAKLDVVKRVIEVKLADAEAKENAAARKEKKEKILGILADKEDTSLRRKSKSDLEKMLDAL